jgi:hypothetical protein
VYSDTAAAAFGPDGACASFIQEKRHASSSLALIISVRNNKYLALGPPSFREVCRGFVGSRRVVQGQEFCSILLGISWKAEMNTRLVSPSNLDPYAAHGSCQTQSKHANTVKAIIIWQPARLERRGDGSSSIRVHDRAPRRVVRESPCDFVSLGTSFMGTALVVADAGRYGAPRACPVPGSSLLPDSASLSVAHGRQTLLVKLLVQPNHPNSFGKARCLAEAFGSKERTLPMPTGC